jgi:site-specific recombinase XerD
MKKRLEDDLIVALTPHLKDLAPQDLRLRLDIILKDYEVTKASHELTVYQGDVNDIVLKRFLAAKIAQGCSKKTIAYYKNSIQLTLEKIGKPYTDVTADDIRLYLAMRIYRDQVTKTTASNERRNLSAFYGWLQKEEILLKNPMLKVDAVKTTKTKKKAFEQMELEKLRDKCRSKRETAILETLISTWARVSEIAQIRIADINDNRLTVHGKGAKDREVYLNARAMLAISNYLSERSDNNPFLFPRAKYAGDVAAMVKGRHKKFECRWYTDPKLVDDDRHIDTGTLESIVRTLGKRAEVTGVHPHRFRRTGATMALRNGMPLIQVSKLLGHENIGTTQIYLDISDEELEQAHKKYVN